MVNHIANKTEVAQPETTGGPEKLGQAGKVIGLDRSEKPLGDTNSATSHCAAMQMGRSSSGQASVAGQSRLAVQKVQYSLARSTASLVADHELATHHQLSSRRNKHFGMQQLSLSPGKAGRTAGIHLDSPRMASMFEPTC